MRDITITLPWEPQPQVSPNSRGSTRNKLTHHRANAGIAILAVRSHKARQPLWQVPDHPAMDVTVYWSKSRKRNDLDNIIASLKGIIDGITRELGFDDRRLVALTAAQGRACDTQGYTVVTIREATRDELRRAA